MLDVNHRRATGGSPNAMKNGPLGDVELEIFSISYCRLQAAEEECTDT